MNETPFASVAGAAPVSRPAPIYMSPSHTKKGHLDIGVPEIRTLPQLQHFATNDKSEVDDTASVCTIDSGYAS